MFIIMTSFRQCKKNEGIYVALDLQDKFDLDTLMDTKVSVGYLIRIEFTKMSREILTKFGTKHP